MRIYTCPACGDSGEHPCIPYDAERARFFAASGLHRARALERVSASNDHDRIHVEQAIEVYLPRAVYALFTLINKIEGLNISSEYRKNLSALLLNAFDQANTMWKVPTERERRHQLTVPPHFRENNIWLALEQGISLWCDERTPKIKTPVAVTFWPEQPSSSGGICIFEGRLISLVESLKGLDIKAVCAALPRPNQAFWTLSALWAGWLWGREAVGAFKSVLHRQRYDWGWHTTALYSVLNRLVPILDPSTSIFCLIGEAEPSFIAAAIIAADNAGCELESISLRSEEDQAQIIWKCRTNPLATEANISLTEAAVLSAKGYLENRGEPTNYLNTITAALVGISKLRASLTTHQIRSQTYKPDISEKKEEPSLHTESTPASDYSRIFIAARDALTYRSGFLRFSAQEHTNETEEVKIKPQISQEPLFPIEIETPDVIENAATGQSTQPIEVEQKPDKERITRSLDVSESLLLWLRETSNVNHFPLTDLYEIALVNYLLKHPGCNLKEIDESLCETFPALNTPDTEFTQVCLDSYGEIEHAERKTWHIRSGDTPPARYSDLETAHQFITHIGERLGFDNIYQIEDRLKPTIRWKEKSRALEYWFYPIVSAVLGEIVLYGEQPPSQAFIVLPGSRANLVAYKLRRDPRLSKAFNSSNGQWRFLKFRHLRSLVENPSLDRENLDQLLGLDPLTYSTPQLRLI
jgi:hypothetical protein